MIDVTVYDGKYRYIFNHDGAKALRYGEEWRDCTGDGLILALAQGLEEARLERDALAAHIQLLHQTLNDQLNDCINFDNGHLTEFVQASSSRVLKQTPATSLAKRDMIKQAEALEEFADNANPNCEAQDIIVNQAYDAADKLRQQAKEL